MTIRFFHLDATDPPEHLPAGEVHVWSAPLDRPADADRLSALLTDDEAARAGRFKVSRIRDQFVIARGLLRLLLGRYLGLPGPGVPIAYEPGGKPVLGAGLGDCHFNVSHSETLAGYAFARGRRVGIDVERLRTVVNAESLVDRFFTPRERGAFFALPPADRQAAFFRAWVCKEAVLKAVGQGVQALDCCDVTLCPDEPVGLLRLDNDTHASERWQLTLFEPAPGFLGAVAVECTPNAPPMHSKE